MDELDQLKLMRKRGLISDDEFKAQQKILRRERRSGDSNGGASGRASGNGGTRVEGRGKRPQTRVRNTKTRASGRASTRVDNRRRKKPEGVQDVIDEVIQQPAPAPAAVQTKQENLFPDKYEYKVIHHRFISKALGKDSPRDLFYDHENDKALEEEYSQSLNEILNKHAGEGWILQGIDQKTSNRISVYGSRPGDAAPREKEYRVTRDLVIIFYKKK